MKPISTLWGKNAELLIVKVSGAYSNHWAFPCRLTLRVCLYRLQLFSLHFVLKLSKSHFILKPTREYSSRVKVPGDNDQGLTAGYTWASHLTTHLRTTHKIWTSICHYVLLFHSTVYIDNKNNHPLLVKLIAHAQNSGAHSQITEVSTIIINKRSVTRSCVQIRSCICATTTWIVLMVSAYTLNCTINALTQCSATFFHPQHTLIYQTHDGTPQNFASRKGGTKLYMAINIYLYTNPCPISVQAYKKNITYVE
jgi:hypothetical protein